MSYLIKVQSFFYSRSSFAFVSFSSSGLTFWRSSLHFEINFLEGSNWFASLRRLALKTVTKLKQVATVNEFGRTAALLRLRVSQTQPVEVSCLLENAGIDL